MARTRPVDLPDPAWPTREGALASRLFSPLQVGAFESRTRTWVPAMVPWRATSDGFVTPEVLDWYGRFAEGRPGVLVVEATGIRDIPSGPLLRIGHDRFVPGLRELVAMVRERSRGQTRLLIQIIDFLRIRRRPEKSRYVREFLKLRPEHRAAVSTEGTGKKQTDGDVREALLALPHEELLAILNARETEALEYGARERVWDTHAPHIAELPRALPDLFAAAAARARTAGFDGVELHYAHAYTMASFLSRLNVRADGYGTTREGRAHLPLEVYHAVRAAVGSDFAVGCRMLGDEVIEGGSRIDDACFFATAFARAGMDFLSISKGGKFEDARQPRPGESAYPYTGPSGLECMPTVRVPGGPFGRNLPLSRAIRDAVRTAGHETPIVAAGGIGTFRIAEDALHDGDCDLVAAARQSLADPDWWQKMEFGRGSETRRCIYTNYCEGLDQKHKQVTCQLWDRDFTAPDVTPSGAEGAEGANRAAPRGADGISRSADGRRRLLAPPWDRGDTPPRP